MKLALLDKLFTQATSVLLRNDPLDQRRPQADARGVEFTSGAGQRRSEGGYLRGTWERGLSLKRGKRSGSSKERGSWCGVRCRLQGPMYRGPVL